MSLKDIELGGCGQYCYLYSGTLLVLSPTGHKHGKMNTNWFDWRIRVTVREDLYRLSFLSVAVGRIIGVAAFLGFSYKKMHGRFARANKLSVNTAKLFNYLK